MEPVHGLLMAPSYFLPLTGHTLTSHSHRVEMRILSCLLSSGLPPSPPGGSPTPVRAPSLCPSFEGIGWHTLARFLWEGGQALTWVWGPLRGGIRCRTGSPVQKFLLVYGVTPRVKCLLLMWVGKLRPKRDKESAGELQSILLSILPQGLPQSSCPFCPVTV